MKNDVHDLSLLLDARARLIVIESWEEDRVLEAIGLLAIKRGQTWYTWNHVDGLQRLGFGSEVDTADDSTDPEKALQTIRQDNQPALYVMCDLHPFLESPRLVRLLKTLALNHADHAPTLLLASHALTLPAELRRLASRLTLSMPGAEQLATIVREEAARWTEQNQERRVRTDNQTLEQVVRNLRGTTHAEARRLARDEIEKGLAPDSGESGVSRRLLGTLLTWMAERTSRVFLVATANDVSQLPPELIRKGRIDEMFFVDMPNESIREDIFRIHLNRRELIAGDFDLPGLAVASAGFSGAEIEQAVVSAVYAAAARQESLVDADLFDALSRTSPLATVMAERITALRDWARGRAVMAD